MAAIDTAGDIADRVREAIARQRMSRQQLADKARISLSTLEKALAGQRPFTINTLVRLEEALGINLRGATPIAGAVQTGVAPDALGAYSRPAVNWLEDKYCVVRPSFSGGELIYVYQTEIVWSEERSHLVFRESRRVDSEFTQTGAVSVPHQSGYIYLITHPHGQYRLIILSRPTITGEMFGIITSLQATKGTHLIPISSPIAFIPNARIGRELDYGSLGPDHALYDTLKTYIERTLNEPFALLMK